MKKIIALAVASAFVAPAFAADVTVGGHVEYILSSTDGADDNFSSNETEVNIGASEELGNGVTVSATINLIDDALEEIDTQGTSLEFSGAFGTIAMGDVSGALDATGDYTDVSPTGGSYAGDGNDHAISYEFPVFVPGLEVVASFSPDSQDNNPGVGAGIVDEASGLSLTYGFGDLEVYYGFEEYTAAAGEDGDKITGFGAKYSMMGLMVAAERADFDDNGNDESMSGLALTYTLGDFDLGYEKQQHEDDNGGAGSDLQNETIMFVQYNMGPVDIYFASVDVSEDDTAATDDADSSRIGVEYVF